MAETWSPRCPTCGGKGKADVTPPAHMIFAGRIRPEGTKPYTFGSRDRCTRCNRWFTIGAGTEWRPNAGESRARAPEPVSEEGRTDHP